MESSLVKRNECRERRVWRVRKKLRGNADRPRLSVYKTNRHISAQIIDDENHRTITSAGTQHKDFGKQRCKSKESAKQVGRLLAEKAKEKAITAVIFDRGRHKFHSQGIIGALAEGAREAGLQF